MNYLRPEDLWELPAYWWLMGDAMLVEPEPELEREPWGTEGDDDYWVWGENWEPGEGILE